MTDKLSDFEGLPVTEVGVEMPNAAGGLQEAMKFQPVEWHKGDEQFVVLRGTVRKIRFDPIDKDVPDGDQMRVHILHVEEAFPITADYVGDYVSKRRDEIKKAKEDAEGVQSFDLDGGEGEGGNVVDLPVGDTEPEDSPE